MATRFTEDVRPITDLKAHATEIVDHAHRSRRPVLITRRGRGVAVLLGVEEYEALSDRAAFRAAVSDGLSSVEAGNVVAHDVAVEVLDSFGE